MDSITLYEGMLATLVEEHEVDATNVVELMRHACTIAHAMFPQVPLHEPLPLDEVDSYIITMTMNGASSLFE